MGQVILVAGATGNLGIRIVKALRNQHAEVRVVVRAGSKPEILKTLESLGAQICTVQTWTIDELKPYCSGVTCVVSALAGLRDVIIDVQKVLLDAAIAAGVPRFIPSDYSLDFTKFKHGENRNLDLRREFHTYLDSTPIAATSIFNGAFMELLTNEMPMLFFKQRIVLHWGSADYKWAFTTMDNTAEFTARVALEAKSPRYLCVAGDLISPREVRQVVSEITSQRFRLFRPGGSKLLGLLIKLTKKMAPAENELYPAWQGMQYMHNMIDERSMMETLDNNRFSDIRWTGVRELLTAHHNSITTR